MSNLVTRLLTALVAVPILLYLLYGLPWWGFGGIAALACIASALEFLLFTHRGDRVGLTFGTLLIVLVSTVLATTDFGTTNGIVPAGWALPLVLATTPAALLFTLFRPGEQATALLRMSTLSMGPLYVGASVAAIAGLRRVGSDHVGAGLVVLAMMIAWWSDTAGYFVGKNVGGPKLYASVSPNKTWSGAIGGVGGSVLGAVCAHFVFLKQLPLGAGMAVAAIAGILGQTGDLAESLMKRSAGVKDSGGLLPGHGGMLDRIDALMFASLALYASVRAGVIVLGP